MKFNNELTKAVIFQASPTSLDDTAEMCEVVIIDATTRKILLKTYLKTKSAITAGAAKAYGLSDDLVEGAMAYIGRYTGYEARLQELLLGNLVIIEDVDRTLGLLVNSAKAFNRTTDWINDLAVCSVFQQRAIQL